tara:strand:+ start:2728 stop:3099 length:372 start_codon:yes stop_codon:yes gene_type:complete
MIITVIHRAFGESEPIKVADVTIPKNILERDKGGIQPANALEYAYRWTNNVMGSWSRNEKVFPDGEINGDYNPNVFRLAPLHENGMGLRSTSMGDHMIVEDFEVPSIYSKTYEVGMFGFKEVI